VTGLLHDPKGLARKIGRPDLIDEGFIKTAPTLAPEGGRYAVVALRSPRELASSDDIHLALAACRAVHGRVFRRSDGVLLAWARRVNL
jgi:hypothetical protein